MRFKGLDLNLLVVFDAVLQERNVSRAAQRLHMSQSGMSGALTRLREFFDDELFVQVGREMTVTPLAASLSGQVQELLAQAQSLLSTRPNFDPAKEERTIRAIVSDYVFDVLLVDVIRHARSIAPRIRFDVQITSQASCRLLERGQADLLIAHELMLSPEHPSCELFQDPHVCCVWSENAAVADTLSLEQYLAMGHAVVGIGAEHLRSFDHEFLERSPYRRREEVIAPSFGVLPQMLVGTDLVATLPQRLACRYARSLPLKILPVPIAIPPLTEILQWHSLSERDPAMIWMRDLIVGIARRG